MPKRQLLYISNTQNSHDARFVRMFARTFDVIGISAKNLEDGVSELDPKSHFDLAVVAGLDYLLPRNLFLGSFPTIGISLGYDINMALEASSRADIVRNNVECMEGIIVDAEYSLTQLAKLRSEPVTRYLICPYGADLEYFESCDIIINKPLSIVVTRSWSSIHANTDIVEAMKYLSEPAKFHFLGVTEMSPRELLEEASKAGAHKIHWDGEVSQTGVSKFLQNGWCYVSASRSDGTSVSLLESLAAGKICVVSDFPSNLEWVTNGVNGFLFENGNPRSLASVLDNISQMKVEDLYLIAKRARESVNIRGRWTVNSARMMEFIENFPSAG